MKEIKIWKEAAIRMNRVTQVLDSYSLPVKSTEEIDVLARISELAGDREFRDKLKASVAKTLSQDDDQEWAYVEPVEEDEYMRFIVVKREVVLKNLRGRYPDRTDQEIFEKWVLVNWAFPFNTEPVSSKLKDSKI